MNQTTSDPETPAPSAEAAPMKVDVVGATDRVLTGIFILAIFYTLYFASALLLPIILAFLASVIFAPIVRELRGFRIPAGLGALVIVLGLLGAFGAGVYFLSEPAANWLAKAPQQMRDVGEKLRVLKLPEELRKATDEVEELTRDKTKLPPVELKGPALSSQLLTGAQSFLLAAVSAIVLLYFLLASEDIFVRKLIHVLPRLQDKIKAVQMARDIETELSRYLVTITFINIGLGAATAFALYLLGVPNPVLWGVMVAALNYIPYLGPLVALVVLSFVALVTFDEIGRALTVPAVFLFMTTIEGQLLNPMIVGHRLTLNPVMVFVSLLVWGWIWGVLGVLLAVPILVSIKIVCDHVDALAPLGEFLGEKRRR